MKHPITALTVVLALAVGLFAAGGDTSASHAPPGPDLWGYQAGAAIGHYDIGADVFVAPCVPVPTGNGRGIAYDPIDGNLWYTFVDSAFLGDGLIHKTTPDPGCGPLPAIPFDDGPGGTTQDDIGALDVDPDDGHLWAAGYTPVGGITSMLYKVDRATGAILQSCGVPFAGGGVGNDTLAVAKIPGLPGSGKYLLTDAGELEAVVSVPLPLLAVDAAACVGGGVVAPVITYPTPPAVTGLTGIDYEGGELIATNLLSIYDLGPPPFAVPLASMPCATVCALEDITLKAALEQADVELLEINKGQPLPAVECETPHQPANGRAMALDPSTGRIYYTESDAFGHDWSQIIEATFTPSTTCQTISECQVVGVGAPIPVGALAHDPGRSAAAGVPVFWGADYVPDGVADIFEVKYTPPICVAYHLPPVPMPPAPCVAHFFQPPGAIDGMDYDPNTDTLWFSDDASQLVFEQPLAGVDPQAPDPVPPPAHVKFEIHKCNSGIAFNPLPGEHDPLWLVEYAINLPTFNIEEVYLSQRTGQAPDLCNSPCPDGLAGTRVFEAVAYDSGLHPPDGRNSRAWEDAEFDEVADAKGDCGVLSNQNFDEVLPSGNNVPQTLHTIIRWSVPCSGVAQEKLNLSEQSDIGLTAVYRNNGPLDPVDILMWKQADAPNGCDISIHTEDSEEITIATGVPYFEKLPDGTLVPLGVGPAGLLPGPSHTIVARGTAGVQFELDVHLVIPNNPSTAHPEGAKLAHHELFDKHCFVPGLQNFEVCVELQPLLLHDEFHDANGDNNKGGVDPNPNNNKGCVKESVNVIPRADVELLEINKGQPIPAVECETPHQPANGRAMAVDPSTGLIYYTEADAFGHDWSQIIEATFTPSTVCPTISECPVTGAIAGKPYGGLPIPIGALAHDPARSAAEGVPVFWAADYVTDGVADIFEVKYTPPVCEAWHLTSVPMPPDASCFLQPSGAIDGMDYDPNTDTLFFSDDASQLVFEQPILGADPQVDEQVPPGHLKFEIVKCNTGIAFNPWVGEPNPLWLIEYAVDRSDPFSIEEVYLSQRSGQILADACNPEPDCIPPAGVQVFEALAYDSGLHPPDIRNSRAWEDAEFDEVADAKGDCGVLSNQNGTEILPSGNNVGQTLHTIIRWSVPCSGVAQERLKLSEQSDIGLTAMYRNNGPQDPVDILMWKQADAPEGCDISVHTEDTEQITIAAGVPYFEKLADGSLVPRGIGPAAFVPGPSHTIVARGTPGVQFELDVHLVIPNNPSTAHPEGRKLAHHELFDKHCFVPGLQNFEICVEIQPLLLDDLHDTNFNSTPDGGVDPNPDNNRGCVKETVRVSGSAITDTAFCAFDKDPDTAGSQFRLILTPDQNSTTTWKLNASNPGQFYYNVFFAGTPGDPVTLNITIPYPFVTQGAVPIQVHSALSIDPSGCFLPLDDITGSFTIATSGGNLSPSGNPIILLSDYSPQAFGSTVTATVGGTVPASGLVYVTIHLDYGLKGLAGCSKNGSNGAVCPSITIPDNQSYTFSFTGDSVSDSQTVSSQNAFKRDPGIGGLVLKAGSGDPVPNVKVQIYDSKGKLLGTVYTDQDGWYMWAYKYTGKPATFTVKLPDYNLAQTVTLKSNRFLVVNFTVP